MGALSASFRKSVREGMVAVSGSTRANLSFLVEAMLSGDSARPSAFLSLKRALARSLATDANALCQVLAQAVDDGVFEAFFAHASPDFWNLFEELLGDSVVSRNHSLGFDAEFLGQFAPVVEADIPQPVLVADFHRKLGPLKVDVPVRAPRGEMDTVPKASGCILGGNQWL